LIGMGPSLRDQAHRLWMTVLTSTPEAPPLARFLADWPAFPQTLSQPGAPRPGSGNPSAQPLPVLRWLPRMAAAADCCGADFVETLCRAAGSLDWRQTYSVAQVGEWFLQNYGWTELLSPGPATGVAQLSCGVLVLGPNTFYPAHRHEAEELYLPLAGTAEWQQGDGAWRPRPPGTLIHHSSEEPHAMRTGEHPLLAMYLWRSIDLSQGARLDRRSAG
jgi:Dimethlysulfonioproprionate lyase